jgi:hypothetical protein
MCLCGEKMLAEGSQSHLYLRALSAPLYPLCSIQHQTQQSRFEAPQVIPTDMNSIVP